MIDYGLKDKAVIITGANNPQGIGAATALMNNNNLRRDFIKSVKFFSFLMSCVIFLVAPSFAMDNSNKSNEDNQKDKAIFDWEIALNKIRQAAIEIQKNKEEILDYMKKYHKSCTCNLCIQSDETDEKKQHFKCICF